MTALTDEEMAPFLIRLSDTNRKFEEAYPGLQIQRQPVQTLYGGANLYKPGSARKMADLALRHVKTYAPDFVHLARGLNLPGSDSLPQTANATRTLQQELESPDAKRSDAWLAYTVYRRMLRKLETEAVEDHRIDFEDGYGVRDDDEEDGHAISTATAMAEGMLAGSLAPFTGIRIKALTEEARIRSMRTMDLFISTLAKETGGDLPQPFKITLPKVTNPEQVSVLADYLSLIEKVNGLRAGVLDIELMIETVQSILTPEGTCAIPALVKAGQGRVTAAILGTFDYTASCNISSAFQDHRHPSVDFARHMMQLSLTGTDVAICDGITNIMPIAPHRGNELTPAQNEQNRQVVHAAWRAHFNNIMHSLRLGFYQSWDLNPAQLPVRYAAVYYFFLSGLSDATDRLLTFINQAAQASMVGNTFDDAASAQGLLNFFIAGVNCGALTEEEVLATGITMEELHARSFLKIVENRTHRI